MVVPLLALSLTACGVSSGDGPQPIDSDIAELLKPEVTPTPAETTKQRLLTVTWVRREKLVRAVRLGVAETRQERLDAALDVLLSGPGPREQTKGFTTLLPPDVVVRSEVKRGRAVIAIELGAGIEPGGLPLAAGQVAVTALAVPRVRSVVFTVGGSPTAVPVPSTRGPGRDTARVVRASDYRSVLAR
ncbi:MAG: GerMN domain-containing protein [Actinomycetia bacterium]|nr:GerMN domain-containing protein [Actinomycetes bacterium]